MDYTTTFDGSFYLNKPLDATTIDLINNLRTTKTKIDNNDNENIMICENMYETSSTEKSNTLHWYYNNKLECIQWDGNEYFTNYVAWLEYLIEEILKPNYILNGKISYQGDDYEDRGLIIVEDNKVIFKYYDRS